MLGYHWYDLYSMCFFFQFINVEAPLNVIHCCFVVILSGGDAIGMDFDKQLGKNLKKEMT